MQAESRPDMARVPFAARVRSLRLERGLTLRELEDRAGVATGGVLRRVRASRWRRV